MNHVYRVVWNRVRNAFMVVAENVSSHSSAPSRAGSGASFASVGVFVLTALSCALFASQTYASGVQVHSGNTAVYEALNGVQVIDIATANQAGLSHNRYLQYNVDSRGQILNNHAGQNGITPVQSQLGGQIQPNLNLNSSARVILNEVVAPNRSALQGYIEVVGGKADVVVANPYGITCSGCGFINTDRATLSTGAPIITNGSLSGFEVRQGELLINGAGIDGRNQQILDLVARQVRVEGQVNGQDLQIAAGSGDYSYADRTASAAASTADAPLYAIDSSVVGGMYANRIRLMATESGVGVRMLGEVAASADDFTLSASGQIEINADISAERDIAIRSSDNAVKVSGAKQLSSKRDLDLTADKGAVELNGVTLTADRDLTVEAVSLNDSSNDGKRYAQGDTSINTSAASSISGSSWGAGSDLNINAGSLTVNNAANLYSGADENAASKTLSVTTTEGDLALNNAKLQSPGQLSLSSAADLTSGANTQINTAAGFNVSAQGDIDHSGELSAAQAGVITAAGDVLNKNLIQATNALTVSAGQNLNSKTLQAGGKLSLSAGGDLTNTDLMYSDSDIEISQAGKVTNQKNLQAKGKLEITADALENRDTVQSGADLVATVSGDVHNNGLMHAQGKVDLTVGGELSSKTLIAEKAIEVEAGSLRNTEGMQAGTNLTLTTTQGDLTNTGKLSATQDISLTAKGTLTTGVSGAAAETSSVVAGQDLHIEAAKLVNHDVLFATRDFDATVTGEVDNNASIKAKRDLTITADGAVESHTLHAGRNLQVGADSLTNQNSIQAVGTLGLSTTAALTNQGEVKANQTITLNSGHLSNSGSVVGGQNIALTATGLTNTAPGSIAASTALLANVTGAVNNAGRISADDTLTLNAYAQSIISEVLEALKSITINAGTLTNNNRIASGEHLTATISGNLTNNASMTAIGNMTLRADGAAITSKTLQAGQTLQINAGSLNNTNSIQAQTLNATTTGNITNGTAGAAASIKTSANATLNAGGTVETHTLQTGGNLQVTATSLRNHAGMEAVGTLSATTTGELNNSGDVKAKEKLSLTTGNLINSGNIVGAKDVELKTAALSNSGSVVANQALSVTSTGTLTNNKTMSALGNVTIRANGQTVTNNDLLNAGGVLDLQAQSLTNTGSLQASNNILLNTSAALSNQGDIQAKGAITVNSGGLFSNKDLLSEGQVNITAAGLSNSNSLEAAQALTITSTGNVNNSGTILSGGNVKVTATNYAITNNWLHAGGTLELAAASLINQVTLQSIGLFTATTTGALNNQGAIKSNAAISLTSGGLLSSHTLAGQSTVTINAGSFNNTALLAGQGNVNITSGSLANSGELFAKGNLLARITGAVTNTALMNANGNINFEQAGSFFSSHLINAGGSFTASVTDDVTNNAQIQAGAGGVHVSSSAGAISNNSTLYSDGNISLAALQGQISSHTLYALNNVTVNAQSLQNNDLIHAHNKLSLTTTGLLDNRGQLNANGANLAVGEKVAVELQVGGAFHNSELTTQKDLNATVGSLRNTQVAGATPYSGSMLVGGAATITSAGSIESYVLEAGTDLTVTTTGSGSLTNQHDMQAKTGNLTLTSAGALVNEGTLTAAQDLSVSTTTSAGSVTNAGVMQALAGDLTVTAVGAVANQQTLIAGTDLTIRTATAAGNVTNTGVIQASAGDLTLSSAGAVTNSKTLTAGADLKVTAVASISNSDAMKAGRDVLLNAAAALNNLGTVHAGGKATLEAVGQLNNFITKAVGDIKLKAASIVNNESLQSTAGIKLETTAGDLTNSKTIQAGKTVEIDAKGNVLNSGTVQAGGSLADALPGDLALADQPNVKVTATGNLTNNGQLLARKDVALSSNNLTNTGRIQSGEKLDVTARGNFTNSASAGDAIVLGLGDATLNVTGSLTNANVLHAQNLTATAASISNQGGISSIGNLLLTATQGNITNSTAFYGGNSVTLNAAAGKLHNQSTGTVDSNGNVTTTSAQFVNNGAFTVLGNLHIKATDSFVNETTGLDGVSLAKETDIEYYRTNNLITYAGENNHRIESEGSFDSGVDAWVVNQQFTYTEKLTAATEAALQTLKTAQLLGIGGASKVIVEYANSGLNKMAVISGKSVEIKTSNANATFTNEALTLYTYTKNRHWIRIHDEKSLADDWAKAWVLVDSTVGTPHAGGAGWGWDWRMGAGWQETPSREFGDIPDWYFDTARVLALKGATLVNAVAYKSYNSGIFSQQALVFSGGKLNNVGSPYATDATKASLSTTQTGSVTGPGDRSSQNTGSAPSVTGPTTGSVTPGGLSQNSGNGVTAPGKGSASSNSGGGVDNRSTGEASLDGAGAGEVDVSNPNLGTVTAPTSGAAGSGVNAPNDVTPYSNKPGEFSYSFGAPPITLPTNPYGYFVMSKNPSTGYLVETNPLFAVGSNFVGSNYLAQRYGFSPDAVQTRLGDANYEGYLIRQQLIQLTGNNVINGYDNEADQMTRLMDQAYNQGQKLGLVFGKTPTSAQLAQLTEDIVWMEEVEVNGQKVLAPKVYLAASTASQIAGGAVISGTDTMIATDSLSNTGGTIAGSHSLDIKTRGDVTNTSGTITGGNVSVTSTEGSIVNKTQVQTEGGNTSRSTTIGKTSTISSSGDLSLDAARDIKVIGANISSGGDGSLKAGGDIVVDTIVDRSTTATSTNSKGFMSSSSSTTVTDTQTNIGSQIDIGGNLKTDSKGNTTIAGSDVSVGGDLDSKTGGSFSVIARQDTKTVKTESSESGFGVADAAYGSQTIKTTDFTGTNSGSTLNVGGNANVDAGNKVVLQGSDVTIGGNATLDGANGVEILDGLDRRSTTSVVETTTFLSIDSGGDADSKSGAESKSNSARAQASASANASAGAEAEVEINLLKTSRTESSSSSSTSVGSTLNVGGDLALKSEKGGVVVQGSDVEAGGSLDVDANSLTVRAGRNESTSSSHTTSTSLGIFIDAEAGAEAEAKAQANGKSAPGAKASAEASAGAEVTATAGLRSKESSEYNYDLTNTTASLKSGGDMTLKVKNDATFQGAEVSSGGDMSIDAGNIRNLAVQDVSISRESSTQTTVGVYASAGAEASVEAKADAAAGGMQMPRAGASAKAEVSAEASAGLRQATEMESSSSTDITQVTNTFTSGGNFSRKATDTIVDQGTSVTAAGDLTQSARVIRDEAVSDSSTSSKDAYSHDLRAGVYAGASAEAGAKAQANPLAGTGADADKSKEAGVGLKASAEMELTGEKKSSSDAVTSNFKAGGSINSTSTEKTTLVGAQFDAGKDINIEAGSLDVQAARNTSSESSHSTELAGEVKVSKTSASAEFSAGFETASESSDTAQTASLNAGGNLNIKTKDSARFEGTDLSSGGSTDINAGGNVDFAAARNKESSSSTELSFEIGGASKKNESESEGGFGVGVGSESSDQAKTTSINSGGNVSVRSGGNTNLEGTSISADGDTKLSAGGKVNQNQAQSTSSAVSFDMAGSAKSESGKETKNDGALSLGIDSEKDKTKTSISSGGRTIIEQGR